MIEKNNKVLLTESATYKESEEIIKMLKKNKIL